MPLFMLWFVLFYLILSYLILSVIRAGLMFQVFLLFRLGGWFGNELAAIGTLVDEFHPLKCKTAIVAYQNHRNSSVAT